MSRKKACNNKIKSIYTFESSSPEVFYENVVLLVKSQSFHHIETSQLICRVNQSTGFYMIVTLAFNKLKIPNIL